MSISLDFIAKEIKGQTYEISLHADNERLAEGIGIIELEESLVSSKILEDYPDDPRGESCLVVGFIPGGKSVHVVCGENKDGHLFIITVYIPAMPKWKDPYTRNR